MRKLLLFGAAAAAMFVPFSISGEDPKSVWSRLTYRAPQPARQPLTIPIPTAFHGVGGNYYRRT